MALPSGLILGHRTLLEVCVCAHVFLTLLCKVCECASYVFHVGWGCHEVSSIVGVTTCYRQYSILEDLFSAKGACVCENSPMILFYQICEIQLLLWFEPRTCEGRKCFGGQVSQNCPA